MSHEKADYATHIRADRLIHIMEAGRKLSRLEWRILTEYLDGKQVEHIANNLGIKKREVYRKMKKINNLLQIAIG